MITYFTQDQSIVHVKNGHSEQYSKPQYVLDENGNQKFLDDGTTPAVLPGNAPREGLLLAITDAVWVRPSSQGKATFDPRTATIRWNGQTITPDTTGLPSDIQAFADAIYTFNDAEQRKVYEALQAEIIEAENREPEPLTPEQEKALARAQIIKTFEDGVKALTSGYTDDEVKSWDAKRRESEIILSGSGEPTPTIDAIVTGLNLDRTEYAQLIQQKAQAYGAAYGELEATMKSELAAL